MTFAPITRAKKRELFYQMNSSEARTEVNDHIVKRLQDGIFTMPFGGGRTNHLVFSILNPMAICGKIVESTSTSPIRTRRGVLCNDCAKLYKKAFFNFLDAADAKDGTDVTAKMRTMIREQKKDWHEALLDF
jgi:hypothetical protein